MIDYIEVIYNLSKDIVVKGKPIDEESNIKISKPYDSWWFPDFFTTNIRFMYKIASKQFHRVTSLRGRQKYFRRNAFPITGVIPMG